MTARECALAAVACGIAAYFAEMAGILRGAEISARRPWLAWLVGRTVPSRTSWLAWVIMYTAYAMAQYRAGARGSLWLAEEELVGAVLIWGLALRHGTGGALARRPRHARQRRLTADAWLLLGVSVILGAWSVTRSAGLAVILLSAAELAATWPTIAKMRRLPGSEPVLTWGLTAAAGAWLVPATGAHADPVLYAYPAALVLSSLAVLAALSASMPFAVRGIPPGAVGLAGVVVPAVAIVCALAGPAAVTPQVFALPFGYPTSHARPATAPGRPGVPHHRRKRPHVAASVVLPGPGGPAPPAASHSPSRPSPPRSPTPAPRPSPPTPRSSTTTATPPPMPPIRTVPPPSPSVNPPPSPSPTPSPYSSTTPATPTQTQGG
jgi:hypothetical protein